MILIVGTLLIFSKRPSSFEGYTLDELRWPGERGAPVARDRRSPALNIFYYQGLSSR